MREIFVPNFARGADDNARGFRAGAMAFDAREDGRASPSAIAIHDNGHMLPFPCVDRKMGGWSAHSLAADYAASSFVQGEGVCRQARKGNRFFSLFMLAGQYKQITTPFPCPACKRLRLATKLLAA